MMRFYALAALAALTIVSSPAIGQLTADALFAPHHIVDVKIELAPEDWDTIRNQSRSFSSALGKKPAPRPFTYVRATVTVDGVRVENVGLRKKGFIGSLDEQRPSLKVKFSQYGGKSPITGLTRLTLNNNKQDRSLLSQYLGYKVFNDAAIASPRCNLAKVTVNGDNLGIYSNVEAIKAPFLVRNFGAATGDLYEGTVADLWPDRLERLELKTADTDIEHIERVARLLAAKQLDTEALGKVVDLDAFIRFWAMESLTGFWDGYSNNQNNYFVYRNPKSGKLQFIPWGLDDAFTNVMPLPPYRLKIKSVHGNAVLPVRLHADAAMRAAYKKTLEGLLADHWDEKALIAEIEWAQGALEAHLHRTQDDFQAATKKVRRFIEKRRRVIEKELARWPLKVKTEPRRPVYFRELGTGTGSFATTWNEDAPADPLTHGTAKLTLAFDGEKVTFRALGVSAERSKWPQGPGERGPQPPTVVFTGKRKSDGKKLVCALTFELEQFKPGRDIKAEGVMFEGALGFMNMKKMKWVNGTATLEAAAMSANAPVKGKVAFKITQMVGGF